MNWPLKALALDFATTTQEVWTLSLRSSLLPFVAACDKVFCQELENTGRNHTKQPAFAACFARSIFEASLYPKVSLEVYNAIEALKMRPKKSDVKSIIGCTQTEKAI